ncbi:MAG: hypothetical protein ACYDBV_14685 [Nitrospiria bacterium]
MKLLEKFFQKEYRDNIIPLLDEKDVNAIGSQVLRDFEQDLVSRKDWEKVADRSLELARMKYDQKQTPWINASNVKIPVIARAALQFSANLTAEIIRHDKVVNGTVLGMDTDGSKSRRAMRIRDYLNYQILYKDGKWQDSLDRAVQLLGVVGLIFKKVYFDKVKKEIRSELCLHTEIVVHNDITSLENARRISHLYKVHANVLVERQRAGLYEELDEVDLGLDSTDPERAMHDIIEQHRYLDLDDDGYEEPYIVTILKSPLKVLSIQPRFKLTDVQYNKKNEIKFIKPTMYFVYYGCIPAFDGSFHSIGFGALLHTLNETMNSNVNQLIDAGTLANTQTGFVSRGLNLKSGEIKLRPGYWHKVDALDMDIGKNIYQVSFKEPSQTLFQLMEFLDQTAKELSSTGDMMTGNQLAQNAPATSSMILIERGMKVYTSVQKRFFRSLTDELRLIFELNREFGDPIEYYKVVDDPEADWQKDFEDDAIDVKPVADPVLASSAQRLAQAQILFQILDRPEVDPKEILTRYLEAAEIKEIQRILPVGKQPPPNPDLIKVQQDGQFKQQQIQLDQQKLQIQQMLAQLQAQKQQQEQYFHDSKLQVLQQQQKTDEHKVGMDAVKHASSLEVDMAKAQLASKTDLVTTAMKVEGDRERDKQRISATMAE